MTKLRVSEDVQLPEDAVTRTFVVYGGKGKGKTNFGAVLCEELAKRRERFCVTDPLDVWWGLQHGRDKASEGIDVVILGGAHGDIPITPEAGEVVADFVSDETVSTIVVMRHADGRMWTNGERIRFMSVFVRALFRRQGEKRIPIMLVVDEAGRFVPQTAGKGDFAIAECIGAIEEAVEWGRNVGMGVTLITQRSARMAKAVSELAECMVAFNTVGPNSVGSIVDWFGEHIDRKRQNELIEALRKLPVGRALIVSPEWLAYEKEAQIRLRETFDSSATPKVGGTVRAPGHAKKPDLGKYRERMAKTIEKAEADDPKKLRARIAELEKANAKVSAPYTSAPPKRVDVPVLKDSQITRIEKLIARFDKSTSVFSGVTHDMSEAVKPLYDAMQKVLAARSGAPSTIRGSDDGAPVRAGTHAVVGRDVSRPRDDGRAAGLLRERGARPFGVNSPSHNGDPARTPERAEGLDARGQRFLDAIATLYTLDVETTRQSVAAFLGVHPRGGSVGEYLAKLKTLGLIEYAGGRVSITKEGFARSTPQDLGDAIGRAKGGLEPRQAKILDLIANAYPGTVTRAQIAEALGVHPRGGSLGEDLGALRGRGLIEYPSNGVMRARDFLFAGVA